MMAIAGDPDIHRRPQAVSRLLGVLTVYGVVTLLVLTILPVAGRSAAQTAAPRTAGPQQARDLRDVLGAAHVAGLYNFTTQDFLNEGADQLLKLGTRVIKVWLTQLEQKYPFHSQWPIVHSLRDMAQTPYFQSLFAKPFSTFILETYAPGRADHYYLQGMTAESIAQEQDDLYQLARYLLTAYRGTGKTFVLQNWESDESIRSSTLDSAPTPTAIAGMIAWINARQAGVERARQDVGTQGVMVAHAVEVNLVARAMAGQTSVTNDVLPHTHADLYSYSAYDVPLGDPQQFRAALDYLAAKAPASKLFGSKHIYVGEFGAPENGVGGPQQQLEIIESATETALAWGVRYLIYWQLYCNEPAQRYTGRPRNEHVKGYWLMRPDGTSAPVAAYFARLWRR